jgi:hypothetical protein
MSGDQGPTGPVCSAQGLHSMTYVKKPNLILKTNVSKKFQT